MAFRLRGSLCFRDLLGEVTESSTRCEETSCHFIRLLCKSCYLFRTRCLCLVVAIDAIFGVDLDILADMLDVRELFWSGSRSWTLSKSLGCRQPTSKWIFGIMARFKTNTNECCRECQFH